MSRRDLPKAAADKGRVLERKETPGFIEPGAVSSKTQQRGACSKKG